MSLTPALAGQKDQEQALFNLDFEDYKKNVKEANKNKTIDLSNMKFNDNYCENLHNDSNPYLFTGILLIILAIIILIFA